MRLDGADAERRSIEYRGAQTNGMIDVVCKGRDCVERHQCVRGHEEIDLAGDQQHPVVLVGRSASEKTASAACGLDTGSVFARGR